MLYSKPMTQKPNIWNKNIDPSSAYAKIFKLLFPKLTELQWMIMASLIISVVAINYNVLLLAAKASIVITIYISLGIFFFVWMLFVKVISREQLTTNRRYFMQVIYSLVFAILAYYFLTSKGFKTSTWLTKLNSILAIYFLVVSIIRGFISYISINSKSPKMDKALADRVSEKQYSPYLLLFVGCLVPIAYVIINGYYENRFVVSFLTLVYVGIFANIIDHLFVRSSE